MLPIVYAYPCRWEMTPARQRYLMGAMAEHTRVVFLNWPDFSKTRRFETLRPVARQVAANLTVIDNAFGVRFARGFKQAGRLAAFLDASSVHSRLREVGVGEYIYWLSAPDRRLLWGMQTKRLVYDCIDPCFDSEQQLSFDRQEEGIAAKAKLVFATAESLLERMRAFNSKSYLLPNGCSEDEYEPSDLRALARPEILNGRTRPVIGYMGTFDSRVDVETLASVARRLPNYTFALVGRINDDQVRRVGPLAALPNVVLPGSVSIEEGRAYVASFDVGLIPFLPGAVGDAINPVKLHMYLMAGKPVVSTWLRECQRYAPHVIATKSVEEFCNAVQDAVRESGARSERSHFFRANPILAPSRTRGGSRDEGGRVGVDQMSATGTLLNTVIIVTLDRPDCVRRCLACLREQTLRADQVIVVDASANDLTRDVVATFPEVEYLRNDNGFGRMTASRNIGLTRATGEVIAFLDDDAFADANWLAMLVQPYQDAKVGAVGGRALNRQPGEATEGVDRVGKLTADGRLEGYFAADTGRVIEVDHLMGCNMSFRRDVLARLGGFREDYPGISGVREDSDMCLRVRRLGYKLVFSPFACVDHLGAPQAIGRRFDLRYAYYSSRNHMVLLLRNCGPGSGVFWRYVWGNGVGILLEFGRRIAAAVARFAVSVAGTTVGLVSGLWLLWKTGRDPVRRDPGGVRISESLSHHEAGEARLAEESRV